MPRKMPRKLVITDFFANGKCVWRKEYPEMLTDEQIKEQIAYISEINYGKVDAITDTTGRMIKFD